ncbi:site-specific integrase [Terrimonas sp.]|uniref:site-specific integrase n=1 Tax=Terrimonas sp. TaxID=1914338 RepID=UPI001403EBE4|nr:site-specific integrase [Terrimonas sp.]
MNFIQIPNRKKDKIFYYYDLGGRGKGQRPATGIFTYIKPKDQIQKNHNKEARLILETKKSQFIIESQAVGTPYMPQHKFRDNFLDYFAEYVKLNRKNDNRHLSCCFTKFKCFVGKSFISPIEITENFCKRFRQYLLDQLTGETPQNYFARFKWAIEAATRDKYFLVNPTNKVSAIANPSIALKDNLEADEYISLLGTPCCNEDVKAAFTFSLYTALRWVDVKHLKWSDIKEGVLVTRIIQRKTGKPLVLTLHTIALRIIEQQRKKQAVMPQGNDLIFHLPTANGANKILGEWIKKAEINKKITWSCARLSFSILLQDERVDEATVANLLGHTTTTQVRKTYKRHRLKPQTEAINVLPTLVDVPLAQPQYKQTQKMKYVYNYSLKQAK